MSDGMSPADWFARLDGGFRADDDIDEDAGGPAGAAGRAEAGASGWPFSDGGDDAVAEPGRDGEGAGTPVDESDGAVDGDGAAFGPKLRRIPRPKGLTPAYLLREYVRKGRSATSIAGEWGLSSAEIMRLVREDGLPLHTSAPPANPKKLLTREFLEDEYVSKGRSAAQIAADLGVSERTTLYYLERAGIARRIHAGPGRRVDIPRDWLEEQYVQRGRSLADIAAERGVSAESVRRLVHEYGFARTRESSLESVFTRSYLVDEYATKGRSAADIAAEHDVSENSVRRWLHRHEIPLRTDRRVSSSHVAEVLTRELLEREYVDKRRKLSEIADDVGVSAETVRRYASLHGIELDRNRYQRSGPGGAAALLPRELLEIEYVSKRRSMSDIADQYGVSAETVRSLLHRYGLPVRRAVRGSKRPARPSERITKRVLEREYVDEGASITEIAARHDVSGETVRRALHRHGIETRRKASLEDVMTEQFLRQQLVENCRSVSELAEELGVSAESVRRWVHRRGLVDEVRSSGWRPPPSAAAALTAELLESEYIDRDRSLKEIADDVGVSAETVRRALGRLGIEMKKADTLEAVLTRDYLEQQYVREGRSAADIAEELGIAATSVLRWIRRHDLPVRPRHGSEHEKPLAEIFTHDYLQREYVERGRTLADIASEHDVSPESVRRFARMHAIDLDRSRYGDAGSSVAQILPEAWLRSAYVDEAMSIADIAARRGVGAETVRRYLHRYDIPLRPRGRSGSEA